eukprot:g1401.t1
MQTGITRGSLEAAAAYLRLLDLISILSELGVFTYFTILENPSAIYFVLAMPSTMLLYFMLATLQPSCVWEVRVDKGTQHPECAL